ncbi:MAG TPA: hypothetical protein VL137_09475, partial [Polyangiaceae bacterium]|nr:hypothetical protein [Polyangiaceae bacterium]
MSQLSLTLRALAGACVIAGSISCASSGSKPAATPHAAAPAPSGAHAAEEPLTLSLLPAPEGVALAPQSCQTRVAFTPPPCASDQSTDRAAVQSADQTSHLRQLAQALQITNDLDRDRALAQLEECGEFSPGLLRALRAELGPANCADVLVSDYFSVHKNAPRPDLKDLLFGLGIAARLDRVDLSPPVDFSAADSKERFMQLFKEQLTPWIVRQAKAIQDLMEQAAALHGYGRGIGAIAAGIADLRFVELTRALPLPKDMAADAELKDAYYGALDQALEPRKERGRDAALVGMKELAAVGVLRSERLTQARQLLSSQYAGRRVDLLDGLLLGPVPSADNNPEQSAALATALLQKLPTYYTTEILSQVDLSSPAALRALFDQGLPQRYRTALHGAAQG